MLVIAFALLGLVIGPLLGVIVDRAEKRERLEPIHRCAECGTSLGARSVVPIAHWFERCPTDPEHRNWRYALTDVLAAVAFASAAASFGWSWQLGPYVAFFAVLVVMSVIDIETHLLLDVLTFPAVGVGLFLVLVLSGLNDYEQGLWPAIIGSLFFSGMLYTLHFAYPAGLGRGDAKMALSLGLFLGWIGTSWMDALVLVFWTLMIACFVLVIFGYSRQILRGVKAEMPMGPALAVATVLVLATPGTFVASLG